MGLQEYLTFCVQALERLLDFPVVHIVLGNEACDLDSVVSAITYACFLHETSTAPVGTALFLPLLQIPRSDFPLRTEVVHFLGKFNISASDLIFLDDLDLAGIKAKTDVKVTLVDHHVLSAEREYLEESVVQILDHRPQDGDLPERCDSTMELVGSCTTLVCEVILADETFTLDPVSATLLYGTIITDTINFSPEAGKTTPKDLAMAERLEALIGGKVHRDDLFEEIKAAKFDLSGLSSQQMLTKDFKVVRGDSLLVAMCSVTMDLSVLMERPDFEDSLRTFATAREAEAIVVMTVCMGAGSSFTRQLGVYSPSRVYRQQMADVLNASHSPSLGLSPLPCSLEEFLPFSQGNLAASRKQVLPIVKSFLAGETTPDETQADAYNDLPKDRSEGFTSMSSIVESRQNTFDGDITSEDLTSRDNSTEADLSLDENLLQPGEQKVFDPLSSIHSSDSAASPTDVNKNAEVVNPEEQLPGSEEIDFDPLSKPDVYAGGGKRAGDSQEIWDDDDDKKGEVRTPALMIVVDNDGDEEHQQGSDLLDKPSVGASISGFGDGFSEEPPPEASPAAGLSHHDDHHHQEGNPLSSNLNHHHLLYNDKDYASDLSSSPATATMVVGFDQNSEVTDPAILHNGLDLNNRLGEEDALEQDFLNMVSPNDLLFPADSPLNVSAATSGQVSGQTSGHASGQTSGQASKVPSYPVTPPNSYMEGDCMLDKEIQLPSFNSSEMVEKIQEKKAALGASGSEDSDALSPFTPQNSYAETSLPAAYFAKETQLPSFHSSDMVERIREKRSSMERDMQGAGAELDMLLDAVKSPFTPPNSFVEGSFDKYAHENLPSLNNAEIANKIKRKQAELTAAASGGGYGDGDGGGGQDSGTASPILGGPDFGSSNNNNSSASPGGAPYTPQNSYQERLLLESVSIDSHLTDLNEVAERLSLTGSESSGSLSEPKAVRVSNRLHGQGSCSSPPPPDTAGFSVHNQQSGSMSSRGGKDSNSVSRKGVSFSSQQHQEEDANSSVMEEAIQKIAYELANEMIQKALETFPSESVKEFVPEEEEEGVASGMHRTHPSISDDSSPTVDESDRELSPCFSPAKLKKGAKPYETSPDREAPDSAMASSTESERLAAQFAFESSTAPSAMKTSSSLADELAQALSGRSPSEDAEKSSWSSSSQSQRLSVSEAATVPKSESYEIETEYLSDMDPMQKMGGVLHPEANVIETDADKEVVEGASFRKISGQEYQTVQEEILEQIRQEAREREMAKLRHSSVAEEDDVNEEEEATETEKRKIVAPEQDQDLDLDDSLTDQQGRKRIPAARDGELYLSALENESAAAAEVVDERTLGSLSHDSHPLAEDGTSDDSSKQKIHIADTSLSSRGEAVHTYESFSETGSLENADGRTALEGRQGENSGARGKFSRTTSAASDVSTGSRGRVSSLKGVELCDEWQDDELPKIIGEEDQALAGAAMSEVSRKRLMPEQGLADVDDGLDNAEVVDSDSEIDSDMDNEQLEWENDTPIRTPTREAAPVDEIPQYSAAEERRDALSWKVINVGEGEDFRLDMRVIEPYKRVLSHGGYCGEGLTAMIVFSACYLPSRDRKDYSYVMNHLFHYVIHTLDELVADDYMVVYFHGATPRRQMPSFTWLKRCYQGIDRRLKKNLKALYLVHPTLWLKTVVIMTRPFISAKFSSKLQFVRTLDDLRRLIPMEYVYIPEIVQRYDDRHFHPSSPSSSTSSSPSPPQQ